MQLGDIGEFGLIDRLRERMLARRPTSKAISDIGDDAAVLPGTGGDHLLLTTDALVDGVHFRSAWMPPDALGWKALAVNVSDIAAMGGQPAWAVVTLGIPAGYSPTAIEDLYLGLDEIGGEHGVVVAGGDIVSSPTLFINVALTGTVTPGQELRRSGAQVGDALLVTGPLGASAAGLAVLEAGRQGEHQFSSVVRAHQRPHPRVAAGRALADGGLATACIDVSDGLGGDLRHICEQSGVGARINLDRLPITAETRAAAAALQVEPEQWAVSGGEDYELLVTVPEERVEAARRVLEKAGCRPAVIGRMVPKEQGITGRRPDGAVVELGGGWTAF